MRARWWIPAVVMLLVVVGVVAFLVGQSNPDQAQPAPVVPPVASSAPATQPANDCGLRWDHAPDGTPVPTSPCYGPHQQGYGLASGFTQNAMGAVIASVNLGARLASAAGEAVYTPTLQRQTVGDYQETLSQLQTQSSDATPGDAIPQEWFWRISAGSPESGLVTVDLAARTKQASELGGFGALTYTLQWNQGDWKVTLPLPKARIIQSTAGYQSLGEVQ
ncbi:hypothetical protein [Amycolatopsis sp. NPDC051903]|uniref:hypothetical protein n=1 Tax=Amycolatopsis sp. NPDC051903 TaxID=3363936 RepID=UPI00378CEBAA